MLMKLTPGYPFTRCIQAYGLNCSSQLAALALKHAMCMNRGFNWHPHSTFVMQHACSKNTEEDCSVKFAHPNHTRVNVSWNSSWQRTLLCFFATAIVLLFKKTRKKLLPLQLKGVMEIFTLEKNCWVFKKTVRSNIILIWCIFESSLVKWSWITFFMV